MDKTTAISEIGYLPTQQGGLLALGENNGRGGVSAVRFTCEQAKNLVRKLCELGADAYFRTSGSPRKFLVLVK